MPLKKTVFMVGQMPDGTIKRYAETKVYNGYGDFGGKDYYVFLAEINGLTLEQFDGDENKMRDAGIELAFKDDTHGVKSDCKYPSLCTDGNWYGGVSPETDPDQGWFTTEDDRTSGLYDLEDNYDRLHGLVNTDAQDGELWLTTDTEWYEDGDLDGSVYEVNIPNVLDKCAAPHIAKKYLLDPTDEEFQLQDSSNLDVAKMQQDGYKGYYYDADERDALEVCLFDGSSARRIA